MVRTVALHFSAGLLHALSHGALKIGFGEVASSLFILFMICLAPLAAAFWT